MTRNFIVIFSTLVLVLFASCKAKDEPTPDDIINMGESFVFQLNDTLLYLCDHEWKDILLSNTNPKDLLVGTPYQVPNKATAKILHTLNVEAGNQRYLCIDGETYYTFCLNNQGSITKAGTKTKYTLRPVRVVAMPKDTIIKL